MPRKLLTIWTPDVPGWQGWPVSCDSWQVLDDGGLATWTFKEGRLEDGTGRIIETIVTRGTYTYSAGPHIEPADAPS